MAGHENLGVFSSVSKTVDENPGSGWMEGDFRFFDAHKSPGWAVLSVALEECRQHTERPQGTIRHIAGEEAPRMLSAAYFLPKFQGFSRSDQTPVDT